MAEQFTLTTSKETASKIAELRRANVKISHVFTKAIEELYRYYTDIMPREKSYDSSGL